MNRRGFLGSILALGAAPAIVRAESLMRIAAPRKVAGFSVSFHESDLVLTIDDFSARYIQPAMATLARQVEADLVSGRNRGDTLRIRLPNAYTRRIA